MEFIIKENYMTKNQKQIERSQRKIEFFRWIQQKEYTVLEDFALRILEKKGACNDLKIAEILCLKESDIAVIMRDLEKAYPNDVQGDSSRRSLCNNFSRNLPSGVAIAVVGQKKEPKKIEDITGDQNEEIIKFLDQFRDRIEFGGRHQKFCRNLNAKRYILKISFYYGREDAEFRCEDIADDIEIPAILISNMKKLLLPQRTR